jgi:sugar-specific transcriptional regulator TrmB
MNKTKRKALSKIEERLSSVKDVINDIKADLEYELTDEEDILNNLESFSGTDRYAAIEEAVDNMSSAVDSIEEAVYSIDEALESISDAQN